MKAIKVLFITWSMVKVCMKLLGISLLILGAIALTLLTLGGACMILSGILDSLSGHKHHSYAHFGY